MSAGRICSGRILCRLAILLTNYEQLPHMACDLKEKQLTVRLMHARCFYLVACVCAPNLQCLSSDNAMSECRS